MTDTRDSFEYAGDLHISKSDYGQISDFRFNRLSGLGAGVYRLFTATPPVVDFDADDVDELKDYRELHAAIVGNHPIWPNGWCQNVAAVAFVINNERQAALQAGAGDGDRMDFLESLAVADIDEKAITRLVIFNLWRGTTYDDLRTAIDNAQATEGK